MAQLFEPGVGWEDVSSSTLPATGVTAGSYGDSSHVGAFTVGADGRITAASNVGVSGGGGTTEYDYVQRTTDLTLGAEADWIVGNSVTYDGATRVKIEVFCAVLDCSGSSSTMGGLIRLYDGVTQLNRWPDIRGTDTFDEPVYGAVFLTPSAGAHTYKVTAEQVGGVGTQVLHAGAVGGGSATYVPAWLRITGA